MSQPFDHSRYDWYPPGLGGPGQVSKSDGSPRAALKLPLREFVVHYGGAGTNWLDFGDTAKELAGVEMYARGENKPNEYNSVSDSAAETWEYSGRFQSAGNGVHNPTTWSHLTLYGLERLTEPEAAGLIAGIRRARAQCVTAGYLTADHAVNPHNHYKQTSCPGPLWTNKTWWNRIIAPLTPADFDIVDPVVPPTPSPPPEDTDMPRVAYIAIPPTERFGQPWLFVADTEVREATSFDLQQGLPHYNFDLVEPEYRVGQYDKLHARV